MTTPLPEDIIIDILARVPRCNYPKLSLVCKHFRSLIASPNLFAVRSLLGCTELCLYVLLYNRETDGDNGWYILRQKNKDNTRLVRIPSLPVAQHYAAMGSKIYVFDRTKDDGVTTTNVLSIDCRYHTVQPLPSIDASVYTTVADVISGKIYVLGYRNTSSNKLMVVLNTETETWELVRTMADTRGYYTWSSSFVMMDGKMYMLSPDGIYVYDPKESRWETDHEKLEFWVNKGCVLDDVFYCYDFYVNSLRTYDPKQRRWGVVKGVEQLLAETKSCSHFSWTEIVGHGRKLALFFSKEEVTRGRWGAEISLERQEIWCAEISLERQENGERIWGKVEWCDQVMAAGHFVGSKCVAVMV
ncbi:F-box/kelch-repeat protein [Raphanus sativus]|uniref:F-box/kelch-repeat protein At4g38940-like n=1 Tax=Raphanus sativus TaxID=3726 RepID=A0A9W3CTF1_RAPSA|nr:F-box/kelch-repeat protein At4g38940-like [Raphanus sativus]KAJ4869630.1 F-box/kelch-repeat protein [Raphanus sativus]